MIKGKVYYGWLLVVVFGIIYFISAAAVMTSAALINPLMGEDLGMSATEVSLGFTAFFLFYGLSGPLVGILIQKLGSKVSCVIGGAIVVLSSILLHYFVQEVILYTFCFVLIGLGLGILMINVTTSIGVWFHFRRGRAMSITLAFGGLGYFVWPIITEAVLNAVGGGAISSWRVPWVIFAVCGVVVILLALLFIKNKPADLGQIPDGNNFHSKTKESPTKVPAVFKETKSITYSKSMRSAAFWIMVAIGSIGYLTYPLCTSLSPSHFTAGLGFDRTLVVGAMAAFGVMNFLGKFISGNVGDYLEPIRLMGVAGGVLCISFFLGAFAQNSVMVYLFYLGSGFFYGTVITLLPTALANFFGKDFFATINGSCMLVVGLLSAVLPIIGGLVFDTAGSYLPVFITVAILEAIACILGLCIFRFPKKAQ
jgi:MFS family permease